jgi:hypothetical protein
MRMYYPESIDNAMVAKYVTDWKTPISRAASRIYQQRGPGWVEAYRTEWEHLQKFYQTRQQKTSVNIPHQCPTHAQPSLEPDPKLVLRRSARNGLSQRSFAPSSANIVNFKPNEVITIEDDDEGDEMKATPEQYDNSTTRPRKKRKGANNSREETTTTFYCDARLDGDQFSDSSLLEHMVLEALNPEIEPKRLERMVLRWGEAGFVEKQRRILQDVLFEIQVKWHGVRTLRSLRPLDLESFHHQLRETIY